MTGINKLKLHPSVYNWGINDANHNITKYRYLDGLKTPTLVWTCPYYKDWHDMIRRCFCQKYQERQPTYIGVEICPEWRNFSGFKSWVDAQPNRDWENCDLDKDFLSHTNFKVYSPETCVYIPKSVNSFTTDCKQLRGAYMLGVSKKKGIKGRPYQSRCNDPFNHKSIHLGYYKTELEAHLVWKAAKYNYACILANLQSDERVANRLREMYKPETDWTDK